MGYTNIEFTQLFESCKKQKKQTLWRQMNYTVLNTMSHGNEAEMLPDGRCPVFKKLCGKICFRHKRFDKGIRN